MLHNAGARQLPPERVIAPDDVEQVRVISGFMECPVAGSLAFDVGRLDDWHPAGNLALYNAASACWPRFSLRRPSLPSSAKRFLTTSSSKDSSSAEVSLSRTGRGVPFGANSAHQDPASNSGSPASRVVGTSGSTWLRSADAVAYALIAPLWICGPKSEIPPTMKSICRANSAVAAGAVPVNGTKAGLTPRRAYEMEPTPACPTFSLAAFAFT